MNLIIEMSIKDQRDFKIIKTHFILENFSKFPTQIKF